MCDFEAVLRRAMGLDAASIGASAIESAVRSRVKACELQDSQAYWDLLQTSSAEVQELVEAVIVPETWFFRDREAFSALVSVVKNKWLPFNPGGRLRLLSLPCSTGEEPYSIAMALLEAGLPEGSFQIDAVDISARSLERARLGIYGRNSFRGQDISFRERFFEAAERGFCIAEQVKAQVRFQQGNLLDERFLSGAVAYDFIFCRNVLIYFDRDAQDRAVRMLDRLLKPEGMLFIGTSEGSLLMSHGFASAQFPQAFAFLRKHALPARKKPQAAIHKPPHPASRPAAHHAAARPLQQVQTQTAALPDGLDEISRLADQGNLSEAMRRCRNILDAGMPSARAFYLMGLIHDASGNLRDAELNYRKALYLEPSHQETLVHLAFLLEQKGEMAAARQFHQRAKRAGGSA